MLVLNPDRINAGPRFTRQLEAAGPYKEGPRVFAELGRATGDRRWRLSFQALRPTVHIAVREEDCWGTHIRIV